MFCIKKSNKTKCLEDSQQSNANFSAPFIIDSNDIRSSP